MPFLARSSLRRCCLTLPSLVAFLSLAGCLDAPNLAIANDSTAQGADPANGAAGGGSSIPSGEHDGMVLVPAVTLPSDLRPTGPDENKGKGQDKEGNDKGPPPAGGGGTTPAPTVEVASFWLDAREVTAGAYGTCVEAGACAAALVAEGCTLSERLLDHPANCVSIDQSRAFCTWSGKRLVRNDEWTAAAAGDTARAYPWGTSPPAADHLNACGTECAASAMYASSDGYVRTAPVGSFPLGRTLDGVDDLGGNVSEWVDGGLVPSARGGSYADVDATTVASTTASVTSSPGPSIGFRCATDL